MFSYVVMRPFVSTLSIMETKACCADQARGLVKIICMPCDFIPFLSFPFLYFILSAFQVNLRFATNKCLVASIVFTASAYQDQVYVYDSRALFLATFGFVTSVRHRKRLRNGGV